MELKTRYNQDPGEAYEPSNATEFDAFYTAICASCRKDDNEDCQIIMYAMGTSIGDENYPSEWIINKNGNPTCSAFEGLDSALPGYRCDKTEDLFGSKNNETN